MINYSIPRIYQITPEPPESENHEKFMDELNAVLESGIKLVQLRVKKMNRCDNLHIARLALNVCRKNGALLVFNGPLEDALEVGCDGVHLTSQALMACKQRPEQGNLLVSAACHSQEQIFHAEKIGVDFVTLSPVLATNTHPDATPLGWMNFSQLVSGTKIPVFALGGMAPEMMDKAKECGAWGIAAISATWRSNASKK